MRPMPRVRPFSSFGLALVLLALGSCGSAPTPEPDRIRDRIVAVDELPAGGASLEFALSQRRVTIDPQHATRCEAMLALAREAKASGREVVATIADSGPRQKGDDGPPFYVVELTWAEGR